MALLLQVSSETEAPLHPPTCSQRTSLRIGALCGFRPRRTRFHVSGICCEQNSVHGEASSISGLKGASRSAIIGLRSELQGLSSVSHGKSSSSHRRLSLSATLYSLGIQRYTSSRSPGVVGYCPVLFPTRTRVSFCHPGSNVVSLARHSYPERYV